MVHFGKFCGQTVFPDMSVLIGQKLIEKAKIQKFKCDIWGDFQTLLLKSSKRKIFRFCSFRSPSIYVDRFNFKGKICKKKLFPFSSLKRSFMQKSPSYARRIFSKQKTSRARHNIIQSQGRYVLSLFAFVTLRRRRKTPPGCSSV